MKVVAISTQRAVKLLDLQSQHHAIKAEVMAAVEKVFDTQQFILGAEVSSLENETAKYCSAAHAVGCASGSDALYLALLALDIGPGDEVVTVPFTFFATGGAIVKAGAKPVFVDIEPGSFNMDPARLALVLDAHPSVRAIMPVHLFGACGDMDPILALAAERGIPVIEDAAQAIGAEYKGRRAGGMGAIGCFSFFPTKNLGGAGDGGLLTTNDAGLAQRLSSLRVHGSKVRYYHDEVGVNSRLDALQAAVLRVKLRHLDDWTAGRQRNAALYAKHFAGVDIPVTLPPLPPGCTRHVYNQFTIRAQRRDELRAYLASKGIGSEIYYPLALHEQVCFADLGYRRGDFPESEHAAGEVLSLPIYPELAADDIAYVCATIQEFYRVS